ncbi:MAG: hypothetical protein OXG70_00585 [Cyanobacteria bacterium MAG IRC1_bin_28]|nr:hypothetical protein [Cyanobacteria bacterium MAG IRC1_bin_28]
MQASIYDREALKAVSPAALAAMPAVAAGSGARPAGSIPTCMPAVTGQRLSFRERIVWATTRPWFHG